MRGMPEVDFTVWEARFARFLDAQSSGDAAHDDAHIARVVANARRIAAAEGANLAVVLPAAWLHDCVTVPKLSPKRSRASRMAADVAVAWLREAGYPPEHLDAIHHAIAAHSWSARIPPETLEAKTVQDADRLDALGAIGIARTLSLNGAYGLPLYHPSEPFPTTRPPDDRAYAIDHFYAKLLTLAETMQTATGRAEARARTAFMRDYLAQLAREIT